MHIGDSTTEGERGTLGTGRWVDSFQRLLRRTYQPDGVPGGFGFIPSFYQTNYLPDQWALTGSPANNSAYGIGLRCIHLVNNTQTATATFYGTGIEIHYTKSAATGVMGVSIDGGAVQNVNTSNGSGISSDGVWASPLLTRGSHTVVVSWVSGGIVYFEGAHILDGDENSGIHTYEAGHASFRSGHFAPGTDYWTKRLTVLQPALITIQLGANDCFQGYTATVFKTNIQTLISRIKARVTITPTIILTSLYTPSGSEATWPAFQQAMREIAAADPAVILFDLATVYGDTVADPYDLLYDYVHANDRGQGVQAVKLLAAVTPVG
ncbi:MAG: SGNH/GDSL hydrolase family protein [Candidatus Saccharimonas sp.]